MKKNQLHPALGKLNFTPPQILFFKICLLFSKYNLFSQVPNNTFMYQHDPTLWYQASDATVMEKFTKTANFPEGIVQFQPLKDFSIGTPSNVMQVTLTDGLGNIIKNDIYTLPNGEDMVPNASSYNTIIKQYIVTGVSKSFTGNNDYGSWYMLFDEDMNPLGINFFELQSANNPNYIAFASNQSTFVTDVCPIYTQSPDRHFAFTGVILENGSDPHPRNNFVSTPTNRRLFISILDANIQAIILQHEYYFQSGPGDITNYTYPSRIVEVKSSKYQNNRGYMIAGTTYSNSIQDSKPFFYLRTDKDLNLFDHKVIDNLSNSQSEILAVGDLFQEENGDEVLVAGTITDLSSNYATQYYFFDKLTSITSTTSVISYLDAWPTNGLSPITQMGIYRMPNSLPKLQGAPKVGRISKLYNTGGINRNVITGSFARNNYYQFNTFYSAFLPNLFEVDYSNSALDYWSISQNTLVDLYPRIYGSLGPVPYYLTHSFESPWYPNHKSFEFSHQDNQFVLGAIGLDPNNNGDFNIINITDRPYTNNNCMQDNENAIAELMPVTINLFTVDETSININQSIYNTNIINHDTPIMTDCVTGPVFKSYNSISTKDNTSNNYKFTLYNNSIKFWSESKKYSIILYNSQGSVISKMNNINQLNINLFDLALGIYFLKIYDNDGHVLETKKISN